MFTCPFCTGPAYEIRRGGPRPTLRYACPRCARRFSVAASDVRALAAALPPVRPVAPAEGTMADG